MSNFFERNKRKGLSALLVLFFKRGKGIGPILVLGAFLTFVFILPSDMRSNLPWPFKGDRDSPADYGFISRTGGPFRGMEDAMRAGRAKGLLGLSGLPGGENMSFYGKSTVNLVKADEDSKGRKGRDYYDGLTKDNQSVSGVLRPEDAKKMQDGVTLNDSEMQHGLTKNVYAGMMAGLPSSFWSSGGAKSGPGSAASKFVNLFKGRASDRQADMLSASIKGTDMPFNGVISFKGTDHSKLGWRQFNSISGRVANNLQAVSGPKTNFFQLAETRAYSIAAAPAPGFCSPPGCPAEFANTTSGHTFDGGKIGGNILTSSQLGETGTPVTPGNSQVQPLLDQANQMEQQAQNCEQKSSGLNGFDAQNSYLSGQIQGKSDALNQANCGGGGCTAGNAQYCQNLGNQLRDLCNQQNQLFQEQAQACGGVASVRNCNQ